MKIRDECYIIKGEIAWMVESASMCEVCVDRPKMGKRPSFISNHQLLLSFTVRIFALHIDVLILVSCHFPMKHDMAIDFHSPMVLFKFRQLISILLMFSPCHSPSLIHNSQVNRKSTMKKSFSFNFLFFYYFLFHSKRMKHEKALQPCTMIAYYM